MNLAWRAANWSLTERAATLARLGRERFELLVVGGGPAGVALAREAALRGLKTGLVEAGDYGQAASERGPEFEHVGLPCQDGLELGWFEAVAEELQWLAAGLPGCVQPLEVLLPFYRGGRDRPLPAAAALAAGAGLARLPGGRSSRAGWMVRRFELRGLEPALARPGLTGGALAAGWRIDSARIASELARDAALLGARAASYVRAECFLRDGAGRVIGVRARDLETGVELEIAARAVVVAAGAAADRLLEGLSRPLLLPVAVLRLALAPEALPIQRAVLVRLADGRGLPVVPSPEALLVGPIEASAPAAAEIAGALQALASAFPHAGIDGRAVRWRLSSIEPRPLSSGSRRHLLAEVQPGLAALVGSHPVLFRRAAEDALLHLAARGLVPGGGDPRPGLGRVPPAVAETGDAGSARLMARLRERYGAAAAAAGRLLEAAPELARTLDPAHPTMAVEVVHAARAEQAVRLADVLIRRTPLALAVPPERQPDLAERAAALAGAELGWNTARRRREVAAYLAEQAARRPQLYNSTTSPA